MRCGLQLTRQQGPFKNGCQVVVASALTSCEMALASSGRSVFFISSLNPHRVNWQTVGAILQFGFFNNFPEA